MVVVRDEKWLPSFPTEPVRQLACPASSAPASRLYTTTSANSSDDEDDDEGSSANNITNHCSPKAVFNMVSKLSEFKKQLVRDMGFGGILEIPSISKLNLKLSSWLLSKLDTEESCLVFGSARQIYVHEADVGIVLGIPNGEIDVSTTSLSDEQSDMLRSSIGLVGSDPRSIRGIEYVLEKHLDDQSSSQEADSFRVDFVVFVVAHLVAPYVKHDQVKLDFWGALKNPGSLDRFNWCRYVYGHILQAAQKVRSEIISKGRASSLTGCHYFLQILFLDNVNLNRLNKTHKVVPRLKVFDQESLRVMATMCASRGENDFGQFIGIRSADSSAYMRWTFQSPHMPSSSSELRQRTTLPYARRPNICTTEPANILSPQTFPFKSPGDFVSYIHKRHPGLERTYFGDYMKNHNTLMMQQIFDLRSSVMRHNAQLVDWLVEHLGASQTQKVHKKTCTPLSTSNVPITTPITATKGSLLPPTSPHTPCTAKIKEKELKLLSTSTSSFPRQVHSGEDHGGSSALAQLPGKALTGKRVGQDLEEREHTKKLKQQTDSGIPPPSFDLGVEFPQCQQTEITLSDKIFKIHKFISPSDYNTTPLSVGAPSCGLVGLSPIAETQHLAQCVVLDIVQFIEDSIDPTGKTLYGQLIIEPYDKVLVPTPPIYPISWVDAIIHSKPDPGLVVSVIHCCRELSEMQWRREWIVHALPRNLVLTGSELIQTFIDGKVADSDIVDAAFRRLNQIDFTLEYEGMPVRWRHFIETDFAMHSLAGYHPERLITVLKQFVDLDFSLPNCKMLVVPVLAGSTWCAYMFDVQNSVVHVLDPAHSTERYAMHQGIHALLDDSFRICLESFFEGWSFRPVHEWKLLYPCIAQHEFTNDQSAIVMIHYARHYNGLVLDEEVNEANITHISRCLMIDILKMEGNTAVLPRGLTELFDN